MYRVRLYWTSLFSSKKKKKKKKNGGEGSLRNRDGGSGSN